MLSCNTNTTKLHRLRFKLGKLLKKVERGTIKNFTNSDKCDLSKSKSKSKKKVAHFN